VTIGDHAGFPHPAAVPTPFDAEGTVKLPVDCIARGVGGRVVTDRQTARKLADERGSTGHAQGVGDDLTEGPMPGALRERWPAIEEREQQAGAAAGPARHACAPLVVDDVRLGSFHALGGGPGSAFDAPLFEAFVAHSAIVLGHRRLTRRAAALAERCRRSAAFEAVGAPAADFPELIARVDRGLYVTRFHYVNGLLDTRRAAMTGMTRDGTYWVEDGVPVHAVRNLRFTDGVLEALRRAEGIEDRAEAVPSWWSDQGAMVAPALLIRGLRFTGAAEPS